MNSGITLLTGFPMLIYSILMTVKSLTKCEDDLLGIRTANLYAQEG